VTRRRLLTGLWAGIVVSIAGRLLDLRWHATHDEFETEVLEQLQAPKGRVVNDRLWLAQVAEDERGLPNVLAFQQRSRGDQHDRVVVHIHHPGVGCHRLRNLVHVGTGGNAGADVQELPDPASAAR
jgi:hypothetical protein